MLVLIVSNEIIIAISTTKFPLFLKKCLYSEFVLRTSAVLAISLISPYTPNSAWANEKISGETLFELKCAGCHSGGGNLFNSGKSLSKADLLKYNLFDTASIERIITSGVGQMPPYGDFISPKGNLMPAKLDENEIKSVAEVKYYSVINIFTLSVYNSMFINLLPMDGLRRL